jgi:hypothetical protein
VRDRQRACSEAACQKARRAKTQAAWCRGNPDYFVGRRLQARVEHREPGPPVRLPQALARLPWDVAQDAFTPQGSGFLAVLGKVLWKSAQDVMGAQGVDST